MPDTAVLSHGHVAAEVSSSDEPNEDSGSMMTGPGLFTWCVDGPHHFSYHLERLLSSPVFVASHSNMYWKHELNLDRVRSVKFACMLSEWKKHVL